MTINRLLTQIRLWCFGGNSSKRTEYARKKGLYAEIGKDSYIPSSLPLYPELVKIHDHVIVHRSVEFVTHDMVNSYLMKMYDSCNFKNGEQLCPIEVFDNVYIGMNAVILGNVRIGPNAIINAGSLVTNDVPENSIVAGVPAKVIGSLDKYIKLRGMIDKATPYEFHRNGRESIDPKTAEMVWERFNSKKNKEKKETPNINAD